MCFIFAEVSGRKLQTPSHLMPECCSIKKTRNTVSPNGKTIISQNRVKNLCLVLSRKESASFTGKIWDPEGEGTCLVSLGWWATEPGSEH